MKQRCPRIHSHLKEGNNVIWKLQCSKMKQMANKHPIRFLGRPLENMSPVIVWSQYFRDNIGTTCPIACMSSDA